MIALRHHAALARGLVVAFLFTVAASCGKTTSNSGTDSSTHWLESCEADSECGALRCLCGTCTLPCTDVAVCPDIETAACTEAQRPSCNQPVPVCVAMCRTDQDCASVRSGLRCEEGQCQPSEAPIGTGGSGGSSAGTGGSSSGVDCTQLPACELLCPEGTTNPVDSDGCTHTCECTSPGPPPDSLRLFYTCGDPVCSGYSGGSGAPLCSTEAPGDVCRVEGDRCDPQDECNSLVVCAASDPRMAPGGCPISRREHKRDIHYLNADELDRYQREVLDIKLATWRYKQDPTKARLGFMIDDNESSAAVDAKKDMIDLYGYTSMVVAAFQSQARQLEALQRQVLELQQECTKPREK